MNMATNSSPALAIPVNDLADGVVCVDKLQWVNLSQGQQFPLKVCMLCKKICAKKSAELLAHFAW